MTLANNNPPFLGWWRQTLKRFDGLQSKVVKDSFEIQIPSRAFASGHNHYRSSQREDYYQAQNGQKSWHESTSSSYQKVPCSQSLQILHRRGVHSIQKIPPQWQKILGQSGRIPVSSFLWQCPNRFYIKIPLFGTITTETLLNYPSTARFKVDFLGKSVLIIGEYWWYSCTNLNS